MPIPRRQDFNEAFDRLVTEDYEDPSHALNDIDCVRDFTEFDRSPIVCDAYRIAGRVERRVMEDFTPREMLV